MAGTQPVLDRPAQYSSLVQVAYDLIKKAILEARMKPGETYKEVVLAQELGMSKTPVHEALTKLAERGFIEILPRRGFRVTDLGSQPVSDLFEFRRPLERTVIYKVVPELTAGQLEHLGKLIGELSGTQGPLEYQEADRAIHRYLASLTENHYLINALAGIWDLCDWIGMRILESDRRLDVWKQHHFTMHEWMEHRDPARAWKVLKQHLDHTEAMFLDSLKATPEGRSPEA
jgi:DNA-binding GntR family transcriptional regulator